MSEKTVYECGECRKLSNKTFVFEGTILKKVTSAPPFTPHSIRAEGCSIECLLKKIRKQTGPAFAEKPIQKVNNVNVNGNGKLNGK